MSRWLRTYSWLLGVLAIAAFAMLFRLGDRPVENWDEGIHGAVSIDMVERGDWVTPWYAGGTYFRKPPLKLWMSAALFDAFGMNTWTLRIPNAIAGILTALLTAWWMWEWRRSRLEAFLAGTIVAIMRPIFFHAFRTGEMDGLLTLFTTVALYCWWKGVSVSSFRGGEADEESHTKVPARHDVGSLASLEMTNKKSRVANGIYVWFALCGAAIGLAVMTKSAAGLLPLPIIAADYLLYRRWRTIRLRSMLVLGIWCLVIITPWHLAMTALHGTTFWQDYFGWHVVKRTTEIIHNPTAGTWWYLPNFARRFTPYVYWFVPALFYAIWTVWSRARVGDAERGSHTARNRMSTVGVHSGRIHERGHTQELLLLWFFITLTLFTIAKTKFDWYLLPLYPAAIMLTVAFLTTARDVATDRLAAVSHLAAIAAFTFFLPAMFPTTTITDQIIERWYALFGGPILLAAIVVAAALGIVVVVHRRWGAAIAGRVAHAIIIMMMMVPGLTVTARHLRARTPAGPFPAIVEAIRGSNGVLVSYGMDYKQHPAGYFILRAGLASDVRVLDGRRRDVSRTLSMLRERARGFLLMQQRTDLPDEIRQVTHNPRTFGDFTLWERR